MDGINYYCIGQTPGHPQLHVTDKECRKVGLVPSNIGWPQLLLNIDQYFMPGLAPRGGCSHRRSFVQARANCLVK